MALNTARERTGANTRHTAWNLEARQSSAVIERIVSNAGHTITNHNTRQIHATSECSMRNMAASHDFH